MISLQPMYVVFSKYNSFSLSAKVLVLFRTKVFSNCSFMSWQHVMSYQDGDRLVTVHTHGDFIVLPHSNTMPLAP